MRSFGSLGASRQRAAGFLVVLAVLTTACGGSSSSTAAAQVDTPESFEDIEFTSPIGEFLGFDGFGGGEDQEARFAEMEREAGRLTTQCMIEAGFEYTPQDTSDFAIFGPGSDELPYFSDAWVDKYGFGISTQRFPQSSVGELVGYNDEAFGPGDDSFVDPNQEYVESLSDGEREAYEEALWGTPPDFDPNDDPDTFDFEPTGCQNEAFDEAFNQVNGGVDFDAFFQEFGDDLEAMEERSQADPAVIEFNDRVAACVTEEGMTWIDQNELFERFETRLQAISPAALGPGSSDPFADAGIDPEEMTDREMEEFFQDLMRLDPADIGTLAEIQAEEIALARVVVDCGGGPLNEQVVLGEIRVKYEQEFIDTNAAALDDFKVTE